MTYFFHEIFYRPIFNGLIIVYQNLSWGDLGLAIIFLTIIIRIILFPLFYKSARDQAILQRLAPKLKEIRENHKDDVQKQVRAQLDFYREHKVHPFLGMVLFLAQLPVFFALYGVFMNGFNEGSFSDLYSFVEKPQGLNHQFLGFIDLTQRSLLIIVFAAGLQYFFGKLLMSKDQSGALSKENSPLEQFNKFMIYLGPALTASILFYLPSAIGLFWLTTTAFSVIQQIVINKKVALYFERLNSQSKNEQASGKYSKTN